MESWGPRDSGPSFLDQLLVPECGLASRSTYRDLKVVSGHRTRDLAWTLTPIHVEFWRR